MRIISTLFSIFFFCCLLLFGVGTAIVIHYGKDLPDYRQLATYEPDVTTRLYASDGKVLAEYAEEKRIFVPAYSIPVRLKQAFISAEDKRFYTHMGIDPIGIFRAVLTLIKTLGKRVEGASTITQQVAKNFLLTNERSLERKIKEAIIAMRMEKAFEKEHILELYLNEIYLGIHSYGVASAALNYFDKSLNELSLAQMAFLAALPKGPNNYHPLKKYEAAVTRRNWVLNRMFDDGYISQEEMRQAQAEPLEMRTRPEEEVIQNADYYAEEVRRLVADSYGNDALYNKGLAIRTSLDPQLQNIAVETFQNGLLTYDKKQGYRGPLTHFDLNELRQDLLTRKTNEIQSTYAEKVRLRLKQTEAEKNTENKKDEKDLALLLAQQTSLSAQAQEEEEISADSLLELLTPPEQDAMKKRIQAEALKLEKMNEEELRREALNSVFAPQWLPRGWIKALVLNVTKEKALIFLPETESKITGRSESMTDVDTSVEGAEIPLSGLTWARHKNEEGKLVPKKISSAQEVLTAGDVVYVRLENKNEALSHRYVLEQLPQAEGALVALDPHTGRVLAMVGGFSYKKSQFNRAVQALRQPGSSLKPFIYMSALDSGYTPSSLILDAPLVVDQGPDMPKWRPKNYSKIFYGPSTLRVGLEQSRNLMTVRLAQAIGMKKVASYVKKFGIADKMPLGLSSALGTTETTLMQMTAAYGMIVNGGKEITPSLIDRIQDRGGKTIYKQDKRICEQCRDENLFAIGLKDTFEAKDISSQETKINTTETDNLAMPEQKTDKEVDKSEKKEQVSAAILPTIKDSAVQVEDPVTAYQMVNILTGVVERGTGRVARSVGKQLAGKSGSSSDYRDAWFIGFSPDLVVGVMVGYDIPQSLGAGQTGGAVAGPIFAEFMKKALADKPSIPFRVPEGVKLVRVNHKTGLPAKPGEKDVVVEAFRAETDLSSPSAVIGKDIKLKNETEADMPAVGGLY
jgi:penicillin-binding protein 1A